MLIRYNPDDGKTYEGSYNPAGRFIALKGYYFATHSPEACEGRNCCIHNPSEHRLSSAPLNWRGDRKIMERICEHGIGHPDFDSAQYLSSIGKGYENVHACDGCC